MGLSRTACADCGGLVIVIRDRRCEVAETPLPSGIPVAMPIPGPGVDEVGGPIGIGAVALTVTGRDWRSRRELLKIRRSDEVVLCQHCRTGRRSRVASTASGAASSTGCRPRSGRP